MPLYNINTFALAATLLVLAGCASVKPTNDTLYEQLGGMPVIENIVDNFVNEIGHDHIVVQHFLNSNINRFREKMIEHLCVETSGPCHYTGDNMIDVHAGKNISELEFNRTVDLLINAMNKASVPHPLQNKLLARLAPLRSEIIYQ